MTEDGRQETDEYSPVFGLPSPVCLMKLNLSLLQPTFAVSQLPPDSVLPTWVRGNEFLAISLTKDELSIVCEEQFVPVGVKIERGWRAFKVEGPLDFSLIGILANLSGILAEAGVSIFAVSTFDTDYILVKEHQLDIARLSLHQAGYMISDSE